MQDEGAPPTSNNVTRRRSSRVCSLRKRDVTERPLLRFEIAIVKLSRALTEWPLGNANFQSRGELSHSGRHVSSKYKREGYHNGSAIDCESRQPDSFRVAGPL